VSFVTSYLHGQLFSRKEENMLEEIKSLKTHLSDMTEEQKYHLQLIESKINAQRPIADTKLIDKINHALAMLKQQLQNIEKQRTEAIDGKRLQAQLTDQTNQINLLVGQINHLQTQNLELEQEHKKDFSELQDALQTSVLSNRTSMGSQKSTISSGMLELDHLRTKHLSLLENTRFQIRRLCNLLETQPNHNVDMDIMNECKTAIKDMTGIIAEKDLLILKLQNNARRISVSQEMNRKQGSENGSTTTTREGRMKALAEWVRSLKVVQRLVAQLVEDIKADTHINEDKKKQLIKLLTKFKKSDKRKSNASAATPTTPSPQVFIGKESLDALQKILAAIQQQNNLQTPFYDNSSESYHDYMALVQMVEQLQRSLTRQQHFAQIQRTLNKHEKRSFDAY
jgi:hypothetical protein